MTDFTQDEDYVEAVPMLAWGEEAGKWDNPPEGWPEGVDPQRYVQDHHARTSPAVEPAEDSEPDGPLTKLLKELLNED